MSEGEFYKRIVNRAQANMSDIEQMMGQPIRVSFSDVKAVLASMIAEFPKVIQKDRTAEYVCMLPGEVEEIADWAKLWLGIIVVPEQSGGKKNE